MILHLNSIYLIKKIFFSFYRLIRFLSNDGILPDNTDPAIDERYCVLKNKATIQIKTGDQTIDNVKIFDINGRLLYEKGKINANETSVESSKFANQVLITQITADDKKIINKKLVN